MGIGCNFCRAPPKALGNGRDVVLGDVADDKLAPIVATRSLARRKTTAAYGADRRSVSNFFRPRRLQRVRLLSAPPESVLLRIQYRL